MNEARYRATERRLWNSVGVAPTEQRVQLKRTNSTIRVQEFLALVPTMAAGRR